MEMKDLSRSPAASAHQLTVFGMLCTPRVLEAGSLFQHERLRKLLNKTHQVTFSYTCSLLDMYTKHFCCCKVPFTLLEVRLHEQHNYEAPKTSGQVFFYSETIFFVGNWLMFAAVNHPIDTLVVLV